MSLSNPVVNNPIPQQQEADKEYKIENRFLVIWRRYRKNKAAVFGLIVFSFFCLVAIFAPLIAPYDPEVYSLENQYLSPSWEHPFGTDMDGGDVFSRTIYGARVSLGVALMAMIISVAFGVTYGAISGYFGGIIDNIMMRIVDALYSIPSIFLLIVIAAIMVPSVWTTVLVISVVGWLSSARYIRGEILSIRKRDYVEAARASGEKKFSIIFYHVLPNAIAPLTVIASIDVASNILLEAGLSYLGLGIQPPTPSWGNMLIGAQELSTLFYYPWIAIFPGICIILTALSVSLIGDGLRDAIDPRMKR